MEIIKKRIKEDLIKEIEQKKDIIEFHNMVIEKGNINELVNKFNELVFLNIDINTQLFNEFILVLIEKEYYDENIVSYCERFIITNAIIMESVCHYLVESYSKNNISTETTLEATEIILLYSDDVSVINKMHIRKGLQCGSISDTFIGAFTSYYKSNGNEIFIFDSLACLCNVVNIIPFKLLQVCYDIYFKNNIQEYIILEKILFSSLMKDKSLFEEVVYQYGDEYIDYCNEHQEYSQERTMVLLEMYKQHKICNIDMLVEFLKYESIERIDHFEGLFDRTGKEIVSMCKKNRKMYFKVGFNDNLILKYDGKEKFIHREILSLYFNGVLMKLYRISKDKEFKRFCCEKYMDDNIFNKKMLQDYIKLGSNKREYELIAYECLLENYFINLNVNCDETKRYINKYLLSLQRLEQLPYKDYVNNYVIGLIENNILDKAKIIISLIEYKFLKHYRNTITYLLFKSIENKSLDKLMYFFEIISLSDSEQPSVKGIQDLFAKYLRNIKFISKDYNSTIIEIYKGSSDLNKKEIIDIILDRQIEDISLLLDIYEYSNSRKIEKVLIKNLNTEEIKYPIGTKKRLIEQNKDSLDVILNLSRGIEDNKDIYEQIYMIAKEEYSYSNKDIVCDILKNIIKYPEARLSWMKMKQPVIDRYSLGKISISNKYLQLRIGENIFSSNKILVVRIENNYKERLEEYFIGTNLYIKNVNEYYLLEYVELDNGISGMNLVQVISTFMGVVEICEIWRNKNIFLYNPDINKILVSQGSTIPLDNFIIRGEGQILSSREINIAAKKINKKISRKEIYEECILCEIYMNFFCELIENWTQSKLIEDTLTDVIYRKINFVYDKIREEGIINSFQQIKTMIKCILNILDNTDMSKVSIKDKVNNFYIFNEDNRKVIFNEIILNEIETEEAVKIILDNINENVVTKETMKYLIKVFTPRIYNDNEIKNIITILNIIETHNTKVEWDEELNLVIERFLDNIIKNKTMHTIFIKNAI